MWSLADLCAEMLHLDLRKPNELRRGSWEKRPLSVDQLFYAAGDAYAGLRLWQVRLCCPYTYRFQFRSGRGFCKQLPIKALKASSNITTKLSTGTPFDEF